MKHQAAARCTPKTVERRVKPCGCIAEGCVIVEPCAFCRGMTESMDAEAARWAIERPGYRINAE